MHNGFSLGIVKDENDFCNRKKEKKDMLQYARNAGKVTLISPRRYGKSSLISYILRLLEKEGFLTVYVDLFPVSSEYDFVSRFAASVFKGIGRGADPRSFIDKVLNLFSRIIPVIEVKQDGFKISVKFDKGVELSLLLDDIMEGVQRYVEKKKRKVCIVFDEFQEITELSEAKKIEGILRSHIQFHKGVSYFYVGSRRRILQDMFTNRGRALYKSSFMYNLGEIPKEDFVPYITERFCNTGKKCPPETASLIYNTVRGYPYYVQKLASIVWDLTEKQCDDSIVPKAYNLLIEMDANDFEGVWSGLSLIQKEVLKALARESTASPYAKEYLERYRLSVGGTQRAVHALLKKDLLEKDKEGRYRLTDPVMAAWVQYDI